MTADNLAILSDKSKQNTLITEKYYNEAAASAIGMRVCSAWIKLLRDMKLRRIWMGWDNSTEAELQTFITESVKHLCIAFNLKPVPVNFMPFIAGQTPAAEFSPDGFVFYGRLSESVIIGQISHEFTHYLQSVGKSSILPGAVLWAYTLYITPVKASATDKSMEFFKTAYANLIPMVEDDREKIVKICDEYIKDGPMFDRFGADPTDDEKRVIREIYVNSILEKEAVCVGDYVRLKLADILHIEKMNFWS